MLILLNGTKKDIPEGTTMEELIGLFQLKAKAVVCELNQQVLDRNRFGSIQLQQNDRVEILHFVGGG